MAEKFESDLRILDVTKILNCDKRTVYLLIETGTLEAYRLNNSYRFKRESVDKLRSTKAQPQKSPH